MGDYNTWVFSIVAFFFKSLFGLEKICVAVAVDCRFLIAPFSVGFQQTSKCHRKKPFSAVFELLPVIEADVGKGFVLMAQIKAARAHNV